MGKTQSKNVLKSEIVNDIVNNVMVSNKNVVSGSLTNVQNMNISGGDFYCNADFSQTINSEMKILNQMDNDTRVQMLNDITTELKKKLNSEFEKKSGFGAIPAGNNLANEMETTVKNLLQNNIKLENINETIAKMNNIQNMNIKDLKLDPCGLDLAARLAEKLNNPRILTDAQKLCTPLPDCKFDQSLIVRLVVESISSNVIETLSTNEALNKLAEDLDASVKIKEEGPLDQFFGFLGSTYGMLIAGLVVIGVIFLFVFLKIVLSPAGQRSLNKAANTAAARMGG